MKTKKKRSLLVDAGLLVFLGLLLAGVNHGFIHKHGTVNAGNVTAIPAADHSNPSPMAEPAGAAVIVPASFRPLNFALLRGGFTSADEFFERVNEDPILHSFYGDCADRSAALHPLVADVMVFSSFRKGNQIKWAQKPLLVRKGEYVMTFCGKTVLARCGNLVSMASMQPSEDILPALLEEPTDPIEPPLSYSAEPAGIVPSAVVPVAAAHASRFFCFVPPFYVPSGGSHSSLVPPVVRRYRISPATSFRTPSALHPSLRPVRHRAHQARHSMRTSGYVLALLLALFIVGVPYEIHAEWPALGPHWAKAAASLVPGARTEGDHVLARDADVTITSQCSGAENIQIFSMLFATVFLMNWKRMQSWKSILVYLSALPVLALINLARIINIIVQAKETYYGLTNTLVLIVLILLVWTVKWLRPPTAETVPIPPQQ